MTTEHGCRAALVGIVTADRRALPAWVPVLEHEGLCGDAPTGELTVAFTLRHSAATDRAAWMEVSAEPEAATAWKLLLRAHERLVLRADNTMPLPTIFLPVAEARADGDKWAAHVELPGMRAKGARGASRLVLRCSDPAHAHHPDDAARARAGRSAALPCPLLTAAAHLQVLCERQTTPTRGTAEAPGRSLRQ